MDKGSMLLPAGAVTLGRETPLRMAVSASFGAKPLVEPLLRVSALPSYSAPVHFDWRRDEPMAAVPALADKAA